MLVIIYLQLFKTPQIIVWCALKVVWTELDWGLPICRRNRFVAALMWLT